EGLRNADGGSVSVCGLDPQHESEALKHEIGAALQSTSLPDKLRVMEALRLFSSFYKRGRKPEELLKRFGLEEKRNTFYNQLSGGATRIEVRLSKPKSNGVLKSLEGVADAREVDGTYVLHSKRPPQTIVSLVKHLEAGGNELVSLEIATPSLEDVFIEMTGRR